MRSVVAHELGHVKHRDVPSGLLWLAIVAPGGAAPDPAADGALGSGRAAGEAPGAARPRWRLPALSLSLAVVSFGAQIAGNHALAPRRGAAPTPTRST